MYNFHEDIVCGFSYRGGNAARLIFPAVGGPVGGKAWRDLRTRRRSAARAALTSSRGKDAPEIWAGGWWSSNSLHAGDLDSKQNTVNSAPPTAMLINITIFISESIFRRIFETRFRNLEKFEPSAKLGDSLLSRVNFLNYFIRKSCFPKARFRLILPCLYQLLKLKYTKKDIIKLIK